MIPVDLLPDTRRDYDDSFDWYAERSDIAAGRFANAIDDALKSIATSPERFTVIDALHRECLVKRFPFRCRVEPSRVLVVAISHATRRPDYWADRE